MLFDLFLCPGFKFLIPTSRVAKLSYGIKIINEPDPLSPETHLAHTLPSSSRGWTFVLTTGNWRFARGTLEVSFRNLAKRGHLDSFRTPAMDFESFMIPRSEE